MHDGYQSCIFEMWRSDGTGLLKASLPVPFGQAVETLSHLAEMYDECAVVTWDTTTAYGMIYLPVAEPNAEIWHDQYDLELGLAAR